MEVNYEQIINEKLGIEDGYEPGEEIVLSEEKPFDADKIRIEQQMLSVKYMYELYEMGILDTNPNFQRKPVWKDNKRKSLLIESLMLRIPIPAFYFYENKDSRFQVIDGQQRLRTIFEFLQGKFKLTGLEYLDEKCKNKTFEQLDIKYQQRIFRTQLAVNVLDARSPHNVIYDIFRRVNTGGIPLTPQEMRNAICSQKTRDFLQIGSVNKAYLEATRNKVNDIRMDSQELFLRFVALRSKYNYDKKQLYMYYSKMQTMLDEVILEIDAFSEIEKNEILKEFEISMIRCKDIFGNHAFNKVYKVESGGYEVRRDLINKALFSAFSVILANPKYENIDLTQYRETVLTYLAEALESREYTASVSGATGDRSNVIKCFAFSQEVIDKCLI